MTANMPEFEFRYFFKEGIAIFIFPHFLKAISDSCVNNCMHDGLVIYIKRSIKKAGIFRSVIRMKWHILIEFLLQAHRKFRIRLTCFCWKAIEAYRWKAKSEPNIHVECAKRRMFISIRGVLKATKKIEEEGVWMSSNTTATAVITKKHQNRRKRHPFWFWLFATHQIDPY